MKKITYKIIKKYLLKSGKKATKKNINYYAKALVSLKKVGKLRGYNFSKQILRDIQPKKIFKPVKVDSYITKSYVDKMLPKKYKTYYTDKDYNKMANSFDSYMKYYLTGKERKTLNKLFKGLNKTDKGKFIIALMDKTGLSFNEIMYGKNGGKYEKNAITQFVNLLTSFTNDKKLIKELKTIEGIL